MDRCEEAYKEWLETLNRTQIDTDTISVNILGVFKAGWDARVTDEGLMAPTWRDEDGKEA